MAEINIKQQLCSVVWPTGMHMIETEEYEAEGYEDEDKTKQMRDWNQFPLGTQLQLGGGTTSAR